MKQLVDRAGALVLVSHRLRVIRELCTEAVWLHKGRVEKIGTPESVIKAYKQAVRAGKA
jgi:ABC-2 type transport system ATP-binding protein/teichoic acid transport system ATP-binding protein